jgi:hypothetical protein
VTLVALAQYGGTATRLHWHIAGHVLALQLPALPPQVRGSETAIRPEQVALLREEWWPYPRRG